MADKKITKLKRSRGYLKAILTKFDNFLAESGDTAKIHEVKTRLERAEGTLEKFCDLGLELEELDEAIDYTDENDQFENDYFRIISIAKEKLDKITDVKVEVRENNDVINVRLPTIDLPIFDGAYDSWFQFKDTFNALIENNPNLSEIQKYYYLNSCLRGRAKQIVSSLEVSGNNYKLAWQLLTKRYQNTRAITTSHVRAIFELPTIGKENVGALRNLVDEFLKHKGALQALKQPVDSWDVLLIYILANKLDNSTRKAWEEESGAALESKGSTVEQLIDFLNDRCRILESINKEKSCQQARPVSNTANTTVRTPVCPICKGDHNIYKCSEFLGLSVDERVSRIKALGLCWNCLRKGHTARECRLDRCVICRRSHNRLIHVDQFGTRRGEERVAAHCKIQEAHVLLTTAMIDLRDVDGRAVRARAMLDVGSNANFITKDMARRLRIKTERITVAVAGMGCRMSSVNEKVRVELGSIYNNFRATLDFLTIENITTTIPTVKIDAKQIKLPYEIELADPDFGTPRKVDVLVGAELFYELLTQERKETGRYGPVLQGSRLGWLVTGTIAAKKGGVVASGMAIGMNAVKQQLEKFWKIEQVEGLEQTENTIKSDCEMKFVNTVNRASDGKFVVHLPKREEVTLGHTDQMALKRFYNLEKRLERNETLKKEYVQFMREYEELGHMKEVRDIESQEVSYYIPHHPIYKETSSTTKLRVVFDASAKSSNGNSLNDTLMVGPVVQNELFTILLRFRMHNVALVGDIEKMYRQVWVHPAFQDLQRIFWRDGPSQPLRTYKLKTLTYGTGPASFLATRCLKQLALENKEVFPEAAKIITDDFYMDDVITGGKDVEEVRKIKTDIKDILGTAGFNLRKFGSNASEVLEDCLSKVGDKHSIREETDNRTLGIIWNSKEDVFMFHVEMGDGREETTKRAILSVIARMFDPLGVVAPVVVLLKMFLQKLWRDGIGWDEEISSDIGNNWLNLRQMLERLKEVKVPRLVFLNSYAKVELHGFSDASEMAYGAAIYCKTVSNENEVRIALLCSKSRVAPLQTITLPRLELCGALLLARLMQTVMKHLRLEFDSINYWTDSTIVLCWIRGEPRRWKTFVANRVAKIQEISKVEEWHHVGGRENPADIVSRGLGTDALMDSVWFTGPLFLYEMLEYREEEICETDSEARDKGISCVGRCDDSEWDILSRFSSWIKLKRVIAWTLRFIANAKGRERRHGCLQLPELKQKPFARLVRRAGLFSGCLQLPELKQSEKAIIKMVQTAAFSGEITSLQKTRQVKTNSNLLRLCPFLDKDGIVRVGGRLANAPLSYDVKFPIVIPKRHAVTRLLIEYEHIRLFHAGPQAILASLKQKYWPLSGRDAVRGVLRKCVTCFKAKPVGNDILMGNLPKERLLPVRPFLNTAVDYAGPFVIKDSKLRNRKFIKAYLCVFVCYVTRAVHLEVATELSTACFLQVFNRFVARRGLPKTMHSDNGTNFVGAYGEIKAMKKNLKFIADDEKLTSYFTENDIEWFFTPARAPHMGGLHEAAVKSAKRHLLRVLGNARLTYEQLYTVVCQTEGILNSRPLYPSSDDPCDLSALTPGHFLIGQGLNALPDGRSAASSSRLKDYQRSQELVNHFWSRWNLEYLHTLQQRGKWCRPGSSLVKIGTLVLLREDNPLIQQWRLGRVSQLFPGADGIVRVVAVRTSTGETRRAVANLCPLPAD